MPPFSIVGSAAARAARDGRRRLRCPSCCTHIEVADLVPGEWLVLHRCGDHVIEVAAREWGAAGAWRWRADRQQPRAVEGSSAESR